MKRLAVSAVGILTLFVASCEPRFPPAEPPTFEEFSKQGAPPTPPPSPAREAEASLGDATTDGESGEGGIYVRTSENGTTLITDTRGEGAARERGPASNKLYRWRDSSGREHITDAPPPAGAEVLGELSRTR